MDRLRGKEITVAMSGGVDSSVTAALLRQAGARVRGVFMRLQRLPDLRHQEERARMVAETLGIPLTVVDLAEEFSRQVLGPFVDGYFAGQTPNPCMVCNRWIKFGRLLEMVCGQHGGLLATGHYARVVAREGRVALLRGRDSAKDQSYFLGLLGQEQLSRVVLPLGEKTKQEVYRLAKDLGISGLHSPESQDVCFLPKGGVQEYLERQAPERIVPGDIVSTSGRVLGRHPGVHRFTIGQRRGINLPAAQPYYVVGIDGAAHRVVVGHAEDLACRLVVAGPMNWVATVAPPLPAGFTVQLRYRQTPIPCRVEPEGEGCVRIVFARPVRAPAAGQFAVLYHGEQVVGAGEITDMKRQKDGS